MTTRKLEWRVMCPDGRDHNGGLTTDEAFARETLANLGPLPIRIGTLQMERCPKGKHRLQFREVTIKIEFDWREV